MPSLQDQQRYMVACRIDGNSTADPDHPYADLTLSGLRELVLSQLAATKGTEVSQTALVTHYSRRKGWCDLMGEAKLRETEFWFQGSYILVRITDNVQRAGDNCQVIFIERQAIAVLCASAASQHSQWWTENVTEVASEVDCVWHP
ncbi:hypothetical protein GGF46_004888 [Coemansia sp. RSA 552]|nr:hypothetical protein GGF46_004888 [Coemansia sp. RSA 552]